jgi:hypothetical protein
MLFAIATVAVLGILAFGVPFLLLRKIGGIRRSLLACGAGFLVSFAASISLLLINPTTLEASSGDTDRVLGPGVLCTVIGPILGVLAAKHVRDRLPSPR